MSLATLADLLAKKDNGPWVPACNGTEQPFITRTGLRLLYCWQPSSGRHAYLNCDTDMIMTDDEAHARVGNEDRNRIGHCSHQVDL